MQRGFGVTVMMVLVGCVDEPSEPNAKGAIPVEEGRYHDYGRLERILTSEPLSEADLAHELELRAAYGLSTEAAHVRALHADPSRFAAVRSRSDMFGNLLLADWEIAPAIERAEVEYRGDEAARWAKRELGDRYAGSFLDGATIVVQCAGCDPLAERAAFDAAGLHEVLRGRVVVREVRFSHRELAEREARVAAFLEAHRLPSNGTTVDLLGNTVRLHVGPSSAAAIDGALAQIERAARGPIDVVREAGDSTLDLNKNQPIGFLLVEAGQAIGLSPSVPLCTSGFAVQNGFGPFIVTAGHCVVINETWYQGGLPLGGVRAVHNTGSFDAALISTHGVRNNWGRIHVDANDWGHPITFGVSTHDLLRKMVCTSGFVTTGMDGLANASVRCGVVTSLEHRPVGGYNATFGLASYRRNQGDSGAGIYWPTGFGFGAAGIHSRSINGLPSPGVFSQWSLIASSWGLQMTPF